jgi:hypothetical protein
MFGFVSADAVAETPSRLDDHRTRGQAILDALDPDSKLTGLLEREPVEARRPVVVVPSPNPREADERLRR